MLAHPVLKLPGGNASSSPIGQFEISKGRNHSAHALSPNADWSRGCKQKVHGTSCTSDVCLQAVAQWGNNIIGGSSARSPLSPLVASRSVHEQGTEPPVAPLITKDGFNAENTFCCLCICTLCNDNRLNPIQYIPAYYTYDMSILKLL